MFAQQVCKAQCQTDRGSIPAPNKSFLMWEFELTELVEGDVAPRCSWMIAARALTSGRRLCEKFPGLGLEKGRVILARSGGAGGTSGSSSGSEGVGAGVGVDGALGDSPSSKLTPWSTSFNSCSTRSAQRGSGRRLDDVVGAVAPPWPEVDG